MMKNLFQKLSLILILGCVSACSNQVKEVEALADGYDFFPAKIGTYKTYDVNEIIINVTKNDTFNYFLRETVFDSAKGDNFTNYFVRQEKKDKNIPNSEWEKTAVWSFSLSQNYLSITQNNIKTMHLIFPIRLDEKWNANSLNTQPEQAFFYQKTVSSPIDSIQTERLITLVLSDRPEDIIGEDIRSEIYTKGIGLISKEYKITEKCTGSKCGDDLGKAVGGKIISQKLIEIGEVKE